MFVWRNAIILGLIFAIVGAVYLWLQHLGTANQMDVAGGTMLIVLGAAMMFTFIILLRGSRGL
jgi:hypothetical protein